MNSVLIVPFLSKKNVNKIEISNWIIWVYMYMSIYVVKFFYLCFFITITIISLGQ